MARFTDELRQPNVGFSPVQGVVDNTAAEVVSAVGGAALEGVRQFKTAQLGSDLEALQQEFLDTHTHTVDEVKAINSFGTQIDRLKQMAQMKGKTDQYRIRAEALLKQHINSMPGLASEFRQKAASMLGFDPSGEEVRQKMQEIEQAAVDAQQLRDFYDKDAVSSFGALPGEVFTKEGQERYLLNSELRRRVLENRQLAELQQSMGTEIDLEARYWSDLGKERSDSSNGASATFINTLRSFGMDDNFIKSLSRDSGRIKSLSPEQHTVLRQSINMSREDKRTQLMSMLGAAGMNTSDRNDYIEQALRPYDEMISVLDGTVDYATVEARQKMYKTATLQSMENNPAITALGVLSDLNVQIPPEMASSVFLDVNNKVLEVFNPDENADPTPRNNQEASNIKRENVQAAGKMLIESWRKASVEGTPEQRQQINTAMMKMGQMLSADVQYDKNTLGAFVDAINDPQNAAAIREMVNINPDTRQAVGSAVRNHALRLANTAEAQLAKALSQGGSLSTFVRRGINRAEVFQFAKPVIQNGVLSLAVDDESLARYGDGKEIGQPLMSKINKEIARINREIISPLNKAATAESGLTGRMTPEESLQRLLEGTQLGAQLFPKPQTSEGGVAEQPSEEEAVIEAQETGDDMAILTGQRAVRAVEEQEGPLTEAQRRVVMLEGFSTGEYKDTKGISTTGVGQTGQFKDMSFKEAFDVHEQETERLVPEYRSFPPYLQAELVQAAYRGDLQQSPKFRRLLKEGRYMEASEEFLDNAEYKSRNTPAGIKRRMEAVANAVAQYATEQGGVDG